MRVLLGLVGVLLLGGCSRDEERASVSVTADAKDGDVAEVDIDASDGSGKVAINLPGGIAAKINVPRGMTGDGADTKFDIEGVGLYPGGKVASFNVRASGGEASRAVVRIGFTAPADAAAVADWYQQQFEAKGVAVTRTGETLAGRQKDGDAFTLALAPAAAGGSRGTLTVTDLGKGQESGS